MFKSFIKSCFGYLEEESASLAKYKFGLIWAAFASKTIRLKNNEISLSWREISLQLAEIFNEWYDTYFTTDAFLRVFDYSTPIGQNKDYDKILYKINNHEDCVGIFIRKQSSLPSGSKDAAIIETNIITGEEEYYKIIWENGKEKDKIRISSNELDSIYYGEQNANN